MINAEKRSVRWGVSLSGAIGLLAIWHVGTAVFRLVNPLTLPAPAAVMTEFLSVQGIVFDRLGHTLQVAFFSFLISVTLAVITAVVLSSSEKLEQAFLPIVVATNSVPRVAMAPIFIFYVGPWESQYLLAAWIAFFPILMSTFEGLSNLDEDLEMLLDSVNATKWQRYKWVRIPNALPFIFDGMKLGVTLALVGTIVVEYIATGDGVGSLAALALGNYDTALGIAVVAVVGFISVGAFFFLFVVQSRVVHWQETSLYG